jgi:hypothetical protein
MNWEFMSEHRDPVTDEKETLKQTLERLKLSIDLSGSSSIWDINRNVSVSIKTLDGMCGVMMAYGWYIRHTGRPFDKICQALLAIGKDASYTKVMTTHQYEKTLVGAFERNGFKVLDHFVNRRTNNHVAIYMAEIT